MLFSSFTFIFAFLPLSLAGYAIASRLGTRYGAFWLVIASLSFYAWWKIIFLPLLLISIAFNFGVSRLISASADRPRLQSFLLTAGVACDILALVYFKYLGAFFSFLQSQDIVAIRLNDIVLPLGISFFTFTQIGYLVDVKQGIAKTRDLLSYVLFVTFFPHLIAGPILHNREIMPQFADPATYRLSGQNLVVGLTIFVIGLAKKTLLADPFSADVAETFARSQQTGLIESWYAVAAYSLQIYFDFSGYSDMAIGLARMFNVRFPLNFNSPYKAATVIDYWQRFHMTLTRFITMYIFSPIALAVTRRRAANGRDVSRKAATTPGGFTTLVLLPTMITMVLAGVWHGAGLQYLVFGVLHGIYIVVNHAMRIFFPALKSQPRRAPVVAWMSNTAKILGVYVAALVAFAFFRASSTIAAIHLLGGMLGQRGIGATLPLATLLHLLALYLIVWVAPNTQEIMGLYEPALGRPPVNPYIWTLWQPTTRWAIATGLIAAIGIIAMGGTTEFLYFQF